MIRVIEIIFEKNINILYTVMILIIIFEGIQGIIRELRRKN